MSCAVEGDAELRVCLRRNCGVVRYSSEDRCGCARSKRKMQQERRRRWRIRTPLTDGTEILRRAAIRSHRAVVVAISAAAHRQALVRRLRPEQRRHKRKAEDQHQRDGEYAPHKLIVARLRNEQGTPVRHFRKGRSERYVSGVDAINIRGPHRQVYLRRGEQAATSADSPR